MPTEAANVPQYEDEANSLAHAASIIEEVAYSLAGTLEKEKVADMILMSAQLEKQARELARY